MNRKVSTLYHTVFERLVHFICRQLGWQRGLTSVPEFLWDGSFLFCKKWQSTNYVSKILCIYYQEGKYVRLKIR